MDREQLLPSLDVYWVGVEVQRSVHFASDEVDSKTVPEWTKWAAMFSITRFRLISGSGGVTEADPILLRPDGVCQGGHELLHGDHVIVLTHLGQAEHTVPGDQVDFVAGGGVGDPGW